MEKKNSSELVEINATVMKETANSINNLMERTGMTMGEAIDRLALHLKPSDPHMASTIVLEEMLYIFSHLDEQGIFEAIHRVMVVIGDCLPEDFIRSLPDDIKAYKAEAEQEYAEMSDDEKAQQMDTFKEFINGIYENDK